MLYHICFANIFSQFVACLFILLAISFEDPTFKILMVLVINDFLILKDCVFCGLFKKILPKDH